MSGIAAFWTEDSQSDHTKNYIHVFKTTSTAQLALSLRGSTDESNDGPSIAALDSAHRGIIPGNSHLACGAFRDLQLVVAVTEPVSFEDSQISIVSPCHMELSPISRQNTKVAMTMSKKETWIYFLSGTDDDIDIQEYTFSKKSITRCSQTNFIRPNSSLAAYFDEKSHQRYIIFQRSDTAGFKKFNVTKEETVEISPEVEPKKGTPIAVTIHKGVVYLYYVTNNDQLRCASKRVEDKWSQASRAVENAPPVGDGQITVVTANNMNHVFYVPKNEIEVKQVYDPIEEQSI